MAKSGGPPRVLEAKIVLLGTQGVGKTSMVLRYTQGEFQNSVTSTIGASFFTHKMSVEGVRIRLQIWDTAGQERFRSMAPIYFRGAHAALCVYDVTNEQTFLDLPEWIQELRENTDEDLVLCCVGNKTDRSDAVVTTERGRAFAQSVGALFFETSAKANVHVQQTFLEVVQQLLVARGLAQARPSDIIRPTVPSVAAPKASTGCC
eukprot:m.49364 g.49364  ORF g.49364 m.49364 type:complete len:205 (+) comp12070_c0_seq1:238-852(+)